MKVQLFLLALAALISPATGLADDVNPFGKDQIKHKLTSTQFEELDVSMAVGDLNSYTEAFTEARNGLFVTAKLSVNQTRLLNAIIESDSQDNDLAETQRFRSILYAPTRYGWSSASTYQNGSLMISEKISDNITTVIEYLVRNSRKDNNVNENAIIEELLSLAAVGVDLTQAGMKIAIEKFEDGKLRIIDLYQLIER